MLTLKLRYDGWLALPTDVRRRLGLETGDRLKAEFLDGAVVLRPVGKAGRLPPPGAAAPARRKPGRPRKAAAADASPDPIEERPRGRPRRARPAAEPSPRAIVDLGPARLVRKAELPSAAPAAEEHAPEMPDRERPRGDSRAFVERRPFRHVEVRKLGPGRGRARPRPAQ